MIKFNKPENINGEVLINELLEAGVSIQENHDFKLPYEPPLIDGNGDLWLAVDESDRLKAQTVLNLHSGGGN